MKFDDITFGFSSAESEFSEDSILLRDGFFNRYNYLNELTKGNKYLILGPKGSGKSAIAWNIESQKDELNSYVTIDNLQDFYYKKFGEFITGSEPDKRNNENWNILLLLRIIDSLKQDKSCKFNGKISFNSVIKSLEENGLLGNNLSEIMRRVDKNEFKVNFAKFLKISKSSEKETKPADINDFVDYVSNFVNNVSSDSYHYLIIDGLDDYKLKDKKTRSKYYDVIGSLIITSERLNFQFKRNDVKAKIIIICRSDIFEHIHRSDLNKIIQDKTVHLDWYNSNPEYSDLYKLVNLRANLSTGQNYDVFDEFFPNNFNNKPMRKYLLQYTRHRPRDIIQLMNYIKQNSQGNGILTHDEIRSGINDYSRLYFKSEIKDELAHFLDDDQIPLVFNLVGAMERTKFHLNEVEVIQRKDERFESLNLTETFRILYRCSAIGNFHKRSGRFSWKYQMPDSELQNDQFVVVHNGLHYALNLKSRKLNDRNRRSKY